MASTRQRKRVHSVRFAPVALGSVLATLLLGVTHLHYPFMGDQALFSVFARMLDDGAVLYADVWDVKQPGIFGFYWLAGRTFGFSEQGVHMLELLYLLGSSLVIMRLLRHRWRQPWVGGLVPVALVGWYYAVAPVDYLTQLEVLVGPLVFGAAWLTWRGGPARWLWAGTLGGLVLFFKLAYLPLVGVVWLAALHHGGGIRAQWRRVIGPTIAGLSVIALPSLIYVLANDLGERVWWTYVTYPPQVVSISGRTLKRLIGESGEFVLLFLPLVLLAAGGLWARRRDALTQMLGIWIAAGLASYLLQLWWGYLLLVVMVPLGLLSLDGLDSLLSRRVGARRLAVLLVAVLPAAAVLASKAFDLGSNGLGIGDNRMEYQAAVSGDYASTWEDLEQVSGLASPGSLYVMGNPLYFFLAGRDQVPAVSGWSPELWTGRLWNEVEQGILEERPGLILVDEFSAGLARDRSPETLAMIEREYEVLGPSTRDGIWYVDPQPPPGDG